MNLLIVVVLFILLTALYFVEALSTVARRVGFLITEPVSGYSVQSFISIGIRFLNLLYMPLIGICLDNSIFTDKGFFVCCLSVSTPITLLLLYSHIDSVTPVIQRLLIKMKATGSFNFLLSFRALQIFVIFILPASYSVALSLFRAPVGTMLRDFKFLLFSPEPLSQSFRGAIFPLILFYICWPLIAVLSIFIPSQSALLLSLSPFLNGWSTLYCSFRIDPSLLTLEHNYQLSADAYKLFVLVKVVSSFFSTIVLAFLFALLTFIA